METQKPKLVPAGFDKDPVLVRDGAVVEVDPTPGGKRQYIRVWPLNSARYEDRLNARRKEHNPVSLKHNPHLDESLQRMTIAELIYRLEEVYGGENEARVEDTYENRLEMLEDRDWWVTVVSAAGLKETFRKARVEHALGNSETSSAGG